MSVKALDLITDFKAEYSTCSGPCPVCHQERKVTRCWSIWRIKLDDGKWDGFLTVHCKGFPRNREELAEHLNRYHVRSRKVAFDEVSDG